jgi:hypothetical protein
MVRARSRDVRMAPQLNPRESVAYLLRAYQLRVEELEQEILDLELEIEELREK